MSWLAGGTAPALTIASTASSPQFFDVSASRQADARSSASSASSVFSCSTSCFSRFVGNVERLLAREPALRKRRLRVDEIFEAQHQRQRVVEFRRSFVQHRAELVVGQERPIGDERVVQPSACSVVFGLPFGWTTTFCAQDRHPSSHVQPTLTRPPPSRSSSASMAAGCA